nr:MAG TPA: Single strand binding protein [Caudoviricetes sp.]
MNSVNLMGRLTSKPELRYTQSNVACCNFAVAVQRKFKNAMGKYEADFINCVAFKNTAETISKYFDKGSLIGIDGRIQTRSYKNKHDETVYITEVIVDSISFCDNKSKTETKQGELTPYDYRDKEDDPFADFGDKVSIDDNFLE